MNYRIYFSAYQMYNTYIDINLRRSVSFRVVERITRHYLERQYKNVVISEVKEH